MSRVRYRPSGERDRLTVPIRPETHRARSLQRRDALLRAAVEVAAERGIAGATHRGVAARAGVPAATTSYFFSSIDELTEEALRHFVRERVAELESLAIALDEAGGAPEEIAERFAAALAATPRTLVLAQFETYLAAGRNPALREAVGEAIAAFERLAEVALRAAGAPDPRAAARAFVALADGFGIHSLARPWNEAQTASLRDALRALFTGYAQLETTP
jgi:DNA-binding transcriptional regulator YbjK